MSAKPDPSTLRKSTAQWLSKKGRRGECLHLRNSEGIEDLKVNNEGISNRNSPPYIITVIKSRNMG
jgi:hypothetical protein